MKKILIVILTMLIMSNINAQQEAFDEFMLPVNFPIQLSGNFSEPRASHFHSGIDIRTYTDGKPLYALADGYVSRILVSPYGYGHAIYIDYENGYRSVYGHLSAFAGEIATYVKNIQYEKESFRIDVNLSPLDIPVKKGQLVGYSGNTGQSGGPHLHFEIREASTDISLNTVGKYVKLTDNVPPEVSSVVIYPQSPTSSVSGTSKKQMISITKNTASSYKLSAPVYAKGKIGIGIEYCDRMTNSNNRYGAKQVDLLVNGKKTYTSIFDKVDFDKQSCKNSCFDFNYYVNDSKYVQKLFVEPNNDLDIYSNLTNNGYLTIGTNDSTKIQIKVTDFNGNVSNINFTILPDTATDIKFQNVKKLKWDTENNLEIKGCRVSMDSATLFDDREVKLTNIGNKKYSPIFELGDETEAVKKSFSVSLADSLVPPQYKSKAFICREIKKKTNYLTSISENGWLSAKTNRFGKFYILIDTVAPTIKPIVISSDMTGKQYMEFKITDNLAGVSTYNIYINDKWVLGEYEPKKSSLKYFFDNRLAKAESYKLKVVVGDNVKNEAVYEYEFKRR
ncbi:MAG: M23 family metallopeptidase [Bacteroidales bacterium]|nr:M23 family metallopeptidase [Bacteroidales bacterium]